MGEQVAAGFLSKIKPKGFYIQQHHLLKMFRYAGFTSDSRSGKILDFE